MTSFIFDKFVFDEDDLTLSLYYQVKNPDIEFKEVVKFSREGLVAYDPAKLKAALELLFLVAGVSYFKTFPTSEVKFNNILDPHKTLRSPGSVRSVKTTFSSLNEAMASLPSDKTAFSSPDSKPDESQSLRESSIEPTEFQLEFMAKVYRDGLSQFIYENNLSLDKIPFADYYRDEAEPSPSYSSVEAQDLLVLQSGGKDSLLVAELLDRRGIKFKPFNMPYGRDHPDILDHFGKSTSYVTRKVDTAALKYASELGGLNGHVPVTYITAAIAMVDGILHGQNWILLSIGHEGDEAHASMGDLKINHQWSKTWDAEKLLSNYISKMITGDVVIGSAIRKYSELKISELFVQYCWDKYGASFSSCNVANYRQGAKNAKLKWCGKCPKCANSFLLFSPFVEPSELIAVIGSDMFKDDEMTNTFKGLLGVDGYIKPFECVGEVDELRKAYHMAQAKWAGEISELKFCVPSSNFDPEKTYAYNSIFDKLDL